MNKRTGSRITNWVVATACGMVAITLVVIFLITRQSRARAIMYSTGFQTDSSIVTLDPNAATCSNSKSLEIKVPDLQEVSWTLRNEIIYFQQALGSKQAQYELLRPNDLRPAQIGPPLEVDRDKLEETNISPSLRYIAIVYKPNPTDYANWNLEILDVRTNVSRQVMTGTLKVEWSPVEDRLAVEGLDRRLYLLTPSGERIGVYQPRFIMEAFVWALDGRQVAFASSVALTGEVTKVSEIYVLDLQTGQTMQLSKNKDQYYSRSVTSLVWSPSKRYIAFISNQTKLDGAKAVHVLYVLDTISGQERKIADNVEWSTPVWDAESQRIAFVSTTQDNNFGQVHVFDLSSGRQTQLTCDSKLKESLSW